MKFTKRITLTALLLAIIAIPLSITNTAHAVGGLSFSEFATHPYASKTGYDQTSGGRCPLADGQTTSWCPVGETINDMGITSDGKIIAGYGDWNSNVDTFGVAAGGVYVAPIDATTGQWDGTSFRVGSEAMDTIREIDGDIYLTQTDPSNIAPTGYTNGNTFGVVTNKGGSWHLLRLNNIDGASPNLEHMFDVASLDGNDIWVFSSICLASGCYNDQASAIRSTDNGNTWTVAYSDISTSSPNGYERYYWGRTLGGKVYSQAQSTSPATPMRVYDGATGTAGTWGTASQNICGAYQGNVVESFDNKLVCRSNFGYITTFDGTTAQTVKFPKQGGGVSDFYVGKDGYLYALDSNGIIYRTKSLSEQWQQIGTTTGVTGQARSIAVYNDYIYLGGEYGKIYRSDTTISNIPAVTPKITGLSLASLTLDNTTKRFTVYGTDFESGAAVSVDGVSVAASLVTSSQLTVTVDTSKLNISGQATSKVVDVTVTNPSGQSATLAGALTLMKTQAPPPTTPTDPPIINKPTSPLTSVDFSKNPVSTDKTTVGAVPSGVARELKNSVFAVDTAKGCSGISRVSLLPSTDFTAPNTAYKALGGVDFSVDCGGATGANAPASFTLGVTTLETRDVHVYKKNSVTGEVQDITSKISITKVNGRIVIAYTLVDGGAFDDDGQANGQIVDPIYIATETPVVTTPVTPTSTTSDGATPLANTGDNMLVIILGVVMTMGAGVAGLKLSRRVRVQRSCL